MKILILICAVLLAGCNPRSPAAIKERQQKEEKCRAGCEEVGHRMRFVDLLGCTCEKAEE